MKNSQTSQNPYTLEVLAHFRQHKDEHVATALEQATDAFNRHRGLKASERAGWLLELARLLKAERDELAALITAEMGKPLNQSLAEVDKCAWLCEYTAETGPAALETRHFTDEAHGPAVRAELRCEPLGNLLLIMPWNFPLWQVFRAACGPLLAGNAIILKHAPNTGGCAGAIATLFRQAAPTGIFHNLYLSNDKTTTLIGHRAIAAVSLTGSPRAGRAVAAEAGRHLKKSVLELGGSDAVIIHHDCDLEAAVKTSLKSRFINTGQTCISSKRWIVPADLYDDFIDLCRHEFEAYQPGDPLNNPGLGSMARPDIKALLVDQVKRSLKGGARVCAGAETAYMKPDKSNLLPALLLDCEEAGGSPAWVEETFGPVMAVRAYNTDEQALNLANRSRYGLGASIYSRDSEWAQKMAGRITAGTVAVNGMVASDPRIPFGGVRESGYGREMGEAGLHEFVNLKPVVYHS